MESPPPGFIVPWRQAESREISGKSPLSDLWPVLAPRVTEFPLVELFLYNRPDLGLPPRGFDEGRSMTGAPETALAGIRRKGG